VNTEVYDHKQLTCISKLEATIYEQLEASKL